MVKDFFLIGALFLGLSSGYLTLSAEESSSSIHWYTNYEQAIEEAQETQKPLLLLFTGTDWCSWCKKLDNEILDKPEFAKEVGDKFVFVKLDFPLYKQADPVQNEKNKALQSKYSVHGFPTIVILNDQEQKLGSTGYQPNTPQGYAQHLLSLTKK